MNYLIPNCPSAIYLFKFTVNAETEELALKKAIPTIKRCEDFAESMHIYCGCDHVGLIEGQLSIRVTFNIKEPQDSILVKVPSLFSFAASIKLILINQFFYPEKTL